MGTFPPHAVSSIFRLSLTHTHTHKYSPHSVRSASHGVVNWLFLLVEVKSQRLRISLCRRSQAQLNNSLVKLNCKTETNIETEKMKCTEQSHEKIDQGMATTILRLMRSKFDHPVVYVLLASKLSNLTGWLLKGNCTLNQKIWFLSFLSMRINREVLQNEFRYDFRKCPRKISAGTVFTVFTCIIAFDTVITVPAEISRGHFRKSYRNSFCKTSLIVKVRDHNSNGKMIKQLSKNGTRLRLWCS